MPANAPRFLPHTRLSRDPWIRWHPACEQCPHCQRRHTVDEATKLNGLLKIAKGA